MNASNKIMHNFLTLNFGVRESHLMIIELTALDNSEKMAERVKLCLAENNDVLFKKEKRLENHRTGEFGSERRLEDQDGWLTKEINSAICVRMVADIASGQAEVNEHGDVERETVEMIQGEEEVTDNKIKSGIKKVLDVLSMKPRDGYNKSISKILTVMNFVHMKDRKMGSISNVRKFNNLCGMVWYQEG